MKKHEKHPSNDETIEFSDYGAGIITITAKCNQNCLFCTDVSPTEFADEPPGVIYQRLKDLRKTTDAVVFAGGEPTINRNLAVYIRAAAELNFRIIRLRTNGLMMSYPEYAGRIISSGLTHVEFMQVGRDPGISDATTRFPGGWELSCKGIESVAGTSVKAAVSIPLLKRTIADLEQHVRFISARFPHVGNIFLNLIMPGLNCGEAVSVAELQAVLPRALDACGEFGVGLYFKPGDAPAPCLFRRADGLDGLLIFPPTREKTLEGFRGIGLCGDCFLRYYCRGIHPQFGPLENLEVAALDVEFARHALKHWPARDEQTRIRAGHENEIGLSPQIEKDGKIFVEEVLLRINYNCNQNCLFCWVEPGYVNLDDMKIKSYIENLSRYEIGAVYITGGEPTLNRNLAEYVSMLKTNNIRKVWLQTNAVLLHGEERAKVLARAGLDFALVSLHSHNADISDMLTGLAGSFHKTVKGILNLRKNGVKVLISHVINSFNYKALPEFVEFVASTLEGTQIVFSVAAPIYGAMMNRGLIPKLSDIKEHLIRALELCRVMGVPYSGLTAMCGIPLCILDGNPSYYSDAMLLDSQADNRDMIKTDACRGCGLDGYCFGLRKNYAEVYGTGELHPVSAEGFKSGRFNMCNADNVIEYFIEKFGR